MSYYPLYQKLIEIDSATSITRVRPRKVYKITSYQYEDGHTEMYSGSKAVLIFVLGIYGGKLYAIKLSDIKPPVFFKWLKTAMLHNLKEEHFHDLKWLESLMMPGSKTGGTFFTTFVKGKPIYTKDPSSFRTYNIKGIKQISWVEFKLKELEKIYGVKHSDKKTEAKETKTVANPQKKTK